MAWSQRKDVLDDETPLEYIHQEASTKSTMFKPQQSIINDQSQATFWSISSFSETSSWTVAQKDNAIEQARRLAIHYIKVIEEHFEMLTQIKSTST